MQEPLIMSLACLKGLPLDHLKEIWPASLSSLSTALESKQLSHKSPTRICLDDVPVEDQLTPGIARAPTGLEVADADS